LGLITWTAMLTRSKNYQDSLLESLTDANEATSSLNATPQQGDNELFLLAQCRWRAAGRSVAPRGSSGAQSRELV